ncbi:hypothetical protein CRG98_037963 [Punica granatum]|uniref:Uncharacterized protein n=1 Tax=Punica granatum TaxID=22663 RepID=A0A2I0IE51_PUNGR|nr:hypothetical protein CRG98_037963 [Punica granatum]
MSICGDWTILGVRSTIGGDSMGKNHPCSSFAILAGFSAFSWKLLFLEARVRSIPYAIRGENVILIGELDLEKDGLPSHTIRVSAAEIRRILLVPRKSHHGSPLIDHQGYWRLAISGMPTWERRIREVGKLQKELTKLLSRKAGTSKTQNEIADLPVDRFLSCPSSLEVDRRTSNSWSHCWEAGTGDSDDLDIEKSISVIIGKCKEICADQKKKQAIRRKSISFLLKKKFIFRSGFAPATSLRDILQESRMEKLLRILLQKKIYPQRSSQPSSIKRYLEDKPKLKARKENDNGDDINDIYDRERTDDKGKWVKTDSDCERFGLYGSHLASMRLGSASPGHPASKRPDL